MKRLFTFLIVLLISAIISAQVPQAFKYQAVVRDNMGSVLAQRDVTFKISIIEGTVTGAIVYSELHSRKSNDFGLVDLEIGKGTSPSGDFSSINWGVDVHFIKVEMDPAGGTSYQLMGTSQLLSVPYALYARKVESVLTDATLAGNGSTTPLKIAPQSASAGQVLKWDGTTWKPAADEMASGSGSNPIGPAGGDLTGSYPDPTIGTGKVNSMKILDGTITTSDLGANCVSSGNIAYNTILTTHLTDNVIISAKIANGAVTGNKIAQAGATTGQVLKWDGTGWGPGNDLSGVSLWQQSGSDIYYNSGKVGIGKIPGADLRQFQVLTANNQAIAGTNNSSDYGTIFAQNQGSGPAADFRSKIRIMDGTQGDGKILTSDANGMASWQSLSIVTDATLTGSGTTTSPLKIAQMGASTGQVLKWNGTIWDNAADEDGPWTEDASYIYYSGSKDFGMGINKPTRKLTIAEGGTEAYLNVQNSSTGYTVSDGLLLGMQGLDGWVTTYEAGNLKLGTSGMARINIESGGDVGIGTMTPAYKLQVGAAGDGTQARANAWNLLSDAKLKKNFTGIKNPLEMIGKIKGYYYYWNTGIDKTRQVGFSAQEVQEVFPEVVSKGEDGYLSIEYGKMTPLLLEAIKELKAENDLLKDRLEKMEKLVGASAQK